MAAFACGVLASACSLFVSLDGLDDGTATLVTDGGDRDGSDAPSDGPAEGPTDASSDGADGGPCSGKAGPAMVAVGNFCIDSTEVTNEQYAAFLAALAGGAAVTQPAALCAWNTDLQPSPTSCPSPRVDALVNPDLPVACVDWCDAYAYCAWAGKRLCGKIGGGGVDFATPTSLQGQWMTACSANGTRVYPYGDSYQPGVCNSVDRDAGHVLPVGTLPGCVGGSPGIYDMAGNVEEWMDSCEDNQEGGANDRCLEIGDSFSYSYARPTTPGQCGVQGDYDERNVNIYDSVGIRCCSP